MFNWLEKYFTFSRTERNGIITLLMLAVTVLLAPHLYFYFKPVEHADNSKYKQQIEAFASTGNYVTTISDTTGNIAPVTADSLQQRNTVAPAGIVKKMQPGYFEFDPNKIGVKEWVQLGFTEKQAESIEKYKAKGGKFYRPQDLMRLYVMDEDHYARLKPYVKIDVAALPHRNYDKY